MRETSDLSQKVAELEAKVRQLQFAALIILNLVFVIYLMGR